MRPDPKIPSPGRTGVAKRGKQTPARQWSSPSVTQGIFWLPKLLLIVKYKKRRTPCVLRAQDEWVKTSVKTTAYLLSWHRTSFFVCKTDAERTGHRNHWDIINMKSWDAISM